MLAAMLKKAGDLMLGEFKVAIIYRLSRVETKIDGLDYRLQKVEGKMDRLEGKVEIMEHRVGRLEFATGEIQVVLKHAGLPIHQPSLLGPGSPLKLTDAGENLARQIDGHNFVTENKNFLFTLLEKLNPTTAYDVQEMAKKALTEATTHPVFNQIKKFAYENSQDLQSIISVLGIILRDAYLEAHPEITT